MIRYSKEKKRDGTYDYRVTLETVWTLGCCTVDQILTREAKSNLPAMLHANRA